MMNFLSIFKKKKTLRTRLLKKLRSDAKIDIKLCRTEETYPHYGIYRLSYIDRQFVHSLLLERILDIDFLKRKDEVKEKLEQHRRNYIKEIIKRMRCTYEKYGVEI